MSNTTVSMRSATSDASLRERREREAEARAAARRRIGIANEAVARHEARFKQALVKLDEAAARLPDLALRAPQFAGIGALAAQDPARVEAYAQEMGAQVDRFCADVAPAIVRAEHLLERRLRKAVAWQCVSDVEEHLRDIASRCAEYAGNLREEAPVAARPARPSAEAEVEEVEAYVRTLQQAQQQWLQRLTGLRDRAAAMREARRLAGGDVQGASAAEALAAHEDRRARERVSAYKNRVQQLLDANGLRREELPQALQARLDFAQAEARVREVSAGAGPWIARHRKQLDDARRALDLMQSPPDGMQDDPALSKRWNSLCGQLQRVAAGLDEFAPSLGLEHEQLRTDAQRLVNAAFSRADWVRALNAEGFEILEREDGQGLVVVDLDHPDTWLEAQQYDTEDGSFVASLELKTDSSAMEHEERVTDDICAKLARVAGLAASRVAAQAEVVEHEARITRGRRPKAFAQRL